MAEFGSKRHLALEDIAMVRIHQVLVEAFRCHPETTKVCDFHHRPASPPYLLVSEMHIITLHHPEVGRTESCLCVVKLLLEHLSSLSIMLCCLLDICDHSIRFSFRSVRPPLHLPRHLLSLVCSPALLLCTAFSLDYSLL